MTHEKTRETTRDETTRTRHATHTTHGGLDETKKERREGGEAFIRNTFRV